MGKDWESTRSAILESGLSVYDDLTFNPDLVYDIQNLEELLDEALVGQYWQYPLRTRSKVAKTAVAEAMGYPVPASFKRTKPRFPGQNLDVYVQETDNLQIWNEQVDPLRRFALIRVTSDGSVTKVRVVTGEAIAQWDHTGTLTSKFQAKRPTSHQGSRLVTEIDTTNFRQALTPARVDAALLAQTDPTSRPSPGRVLPISEIHERLSKLIGITFLDPGVTRERTRGTVLQRLACEALGLDKYGDIGQFPDILCQALEVKLQLSPTIDLGLVLPDDDLLAQELGGFLRHRDCRYAVAYASRLDTDEIRIESIVTTTGAAFFEEFVKFAGRIENKKLQIPLPRDLFKAE